MSASAQGGQKRALDYLELVTGGWKLSIVATGNQILASNCNCP